MSLSSAIAARDVTELPSRRDEDWRWTDLKGLLRVLPPPSPVHEAPLPPGPFGALGEAEVAVVNGHVPPHAGVLVLGPGASRVVRLRFVAATDATAHGAHVAIRLGAHARLTLLESHEGQASDYLADAQLDIRLDEGAVLERVVIAADGEGSVRVVQAQVLLAAGAAYAQTVLTDGAKRQRLEARIAHPGAGAKVRLDGVYLLANQRHADLTTVVDHQGVDGATTQLAKGVVRDQARGVFQGRIVVEEGADRTDARMGHHALVLSDRAEVDAKPELLINADDVQCAHGNTVGALDEEAMFYMRQRGISEPEARALLISAFIGEVIDRIEHEAARDLARAWAAGRLET